MRLKVASATVAAVAGLIIAGAGTAEAAQVGNDKRGGFSGQHVWIKVGRAELAQKGNGMRACTSSGLSAYYCGHLGGSVDTQKRRNPKANGYWAEFYYNTGRNRSGTW